MKKNTTFHNLFQKIVSEEEVAVIQEALGYKDTARMLNVGTLIHYLLCASMNELKSYRDCADVGDQYGLPKVNYSTLYNLTIDWRSEMAVVLKKHRKLQGVDYPNFG